ncbi:MAG: DUF4184 family protein [Gammaproteobacteria bacterium]
MPFTLTHIAAAIPIKKLTGSILPFTALAIGTMVPDMPIFFNVVSSYSQTHSLTGLFTACLPIGLVMYVIFELLVRTALLELMPWAISQRLGERSTHNAKYLAGIVAALILGAGSHVLWDSFTHHIGWGVDLVPALKTRVVLFGHSHGYYKLLQHGSSVVLLPLMAWWLYRWTKAPYTPPAKPFKCRLMLPLWLKLAGCSIIFVAPAIVALIEAWIQTRSFYYGIGPAARAYGRYLVITSVGFSIMIHLSIWLRGRLSLSHASLNR